MTANPPSASNDETVVRKLLEAVSALRIDDAAALLSPDLLLELPFRHDGGQSVLRGEAALRFIRSMSRLFSRMDFIGITVHGRAGSGVIAAEYRSNGLTKAGESYVNGYAGFFDVRDGKVTRWREYYDPVVIQKAFKLP